MLVPTIVNYDVYPTIHNALIKECYDVHQTIEVNLRGGSDRFYCQLISVIYEPYRTAEVNLRE